VTIELEHVSKRFGDWLAVDDATLTIEDGSLTALLGPSGSGKSTMLRTIAGLEQPDSGQVRIAGIDRTGDAPQDRGIGFVFQHYAAFRHMTVADNIAFGLRIRKVPRKERRARVDELISLVQLEGLADRYPSQLSGGQRQRMALARALAPQPNVLLLDEPFGALDAQVRDDLRAWLRQLHDEVHVTTILVTHDRDEAMEVADQIVVMNRGRIEQVGPPRELYERPVNEFVMGFLGPVNAVGDELVRPFDLEIVRLGDTDGGRADEGFARAVVDRVTHYGFDVRVALTREDDVRLDVQLTRTEADLLDLHRGETVLVRSRQGTRFDDVPIVEPAAH
jgi:sulfate transport system ATP-binding protein